MLSMSFRFLLAVPDHLRSPVLHTLHGDVSGEYMYRYCTHSSAHKTAVLLAHNESGDLSIYSELVPAPALYAAHLSSARCIGHIQN